MKKFLTLCLVVFTLVFTVSCFAQTTYTNDGLKLTVPEEYADKLLVETANLLEKSFPQENDVVIRMGGDEFLILCCGIDRKGARRKIEEVAAEAAQISIADTPISFEYGICTLSKEEFDFEEGLRLSDVELLKKKDEYHGRA